MIGIICAMDVELKQIRELACECENITLGQCMVQSAFGIAGAWVGCKLADLGEAVK